MRATRWHRSASSNRACDAHDVHLALILVDPKWDAFRSHDRFFALINRCAFTAGSPRGTA
jgi:hypothetical protein